MRRTPLFPSGKLPFERGLVAPLLLAILLGGLIGVGVFTCLRRLWPPLTMRL